MTNFQKLIDALQQIGIKNIDDRDLFAYLSIARDGMVGAEKVTRLDLYNVLNALAGDSFAFQAKTPDELLVVDTFDKMDKAAAFGMLDYPLVIRKNDLDSLDYSVLPGDPKDIRERKLDRQSPSTQGWYEFRIEQDRSRA